MKQKSVGLTLRAFIIALALILVAGSPALPPFDGVAYAQNTVTTLSYLPVPGTSNLELDWTAVDNADSYRLWKAEGLVTTVAGWGDAPHMTFDGSTTVYVDENVTAGTTYSYVLEAYDGDTRLGYSNVLEIIGTAKPTAQPTVTLAPMGSNAIKVTWTQVPTATHYRVRYWTAGMSGWMDLDDDATGLTLTHENLEAGRQYYYIVRGENSGGDGPYSGSPGNYVSHTIPATTDVPVLSFEQTSRTVVELDWTDAPAGSTYRLERRKVTTDSADTPVSVPADNSGWAQLGGGNLTASSHTDSAANYVPDTTGTAPFTVRYEYRVQALDSNDVASDWSNVVSVSIPAAGAVLAAPATISASPVSSSSTRVTWAAVTGATFYEIQWKSGDGNYNTFFRVDGTTYEHGNLSPSTKYTYKVRAVDINGPGDPSAEAPATTLSVVAAAGQLPKVTGLTVTDATTSNTGGTRTAKLTWNAVSNATHYEIHRYNPGLAAPVWGAAPDGNDLTGGFITIANAGTSPSWEDEITTAGAEASNDAEGAGQTYFYVVSAVNAGISAGLTDGDEELGEWSDYKSVTFVDFAPGVPTGLSAAKTNGGSIIVRWTQPADTRVADPALGVATSWTIHWRTAATTTWSPIAVTGATSHHHTGLSGNTTYYYRVRAENSGGQSDFTDPISETLGNALTAPTGVRAVDATDGTTAGIKVSWNAVTGADSYEVQRFGAGTDGDQWGELDVAAATQTVDAVTAVSTGTTVTDDGGLSANMTYLYRVRMVKEGVMSGWSAVASGTTMAAEVTEAPTLSAITTGQSMIRLSWEAVPGATAYHLEWLEGAQDATFFDNPNTNPPRITISGNFRHYVHTGRKAGTQYSYRLRAVFADSEGDWTVPAAATQPWTKPAAPDVSAAATNDTTITLTWKAVTIGAGKLGAGTDTGTYRVEQRIAGSGGAWEAVTATLTSGSCDTTCELPITGLTEKTHYQFRVRAESSATTGDHNSYWDYANQRTPAAASN